MTDIISYILLNDVAGIHYHIENGGDCGQTTSSGSTPLHYAAYTGNVEIVDLLLNTNIRVDAKDVDGVTALHRAAQENHAVIAERLIEAGCNVKLFCKLFQTSLHCCAINGSYDTAQVILRNTTDHIDKTDMQGCTALHHAAYYGFANVFDLLVKHGADIHAKDKSGMNALHWACLGGKTKIMQYLIDYGIDVNIRDRHSRTSLHYAAMSSSESLLRILCSTESLILDAEDVHGFSALHYSVLDGNLGSVKILLDAGCDYKLASVDGTTAVHVAAYHSENTDVMILLAKRFGKLLSVPTKAGVTPLHVACLMDRPSRLNELLEANVDVNARCSIGSTPIHWAIEAGNVNAVQGLLEFQADPNIQLNDGQTPLHLAVGRGNYMMVDTLLSYHAEVDKCDRNGQTCLMLACQLKPKLSYQIIELLLRYDSDVDRTDHNGWNALHFAAYKGNTLAVLLLISAGCNADVLDNFGRLPLHYVVRKINNKVDHRPDVLQELLKVTPSEMLEKHDRYGYSPVHYSAYHGNHKATIALFEKTNCTKLAVSECPLRVTPMHLAALAGHASVLSLIYTFAKEHWNDFEATSILTTTDSVQRIPLHYAMSKGSCNAVKELLRGSNATGQLGWSDVNGLTPLHLAAALGHSNLIDHVLTSFPNTLVNITDLKKRTCGMLAVTSLTEPSILLMERTNFRLTDRYGRGFLHRACYTRRTEILVTVMSKCDVNAKDVDGVTAMHVAAAVGDQDSVVQLMGCGANPQKLDKRGLSPADWAAAFGKINILAYFLDGKWNDSGDHSRNSSASVSSGTYMVSESSLLLAARGGHVDCAVLLLEHYPKLVDTKDFRGRSPIHYAAEFGHYEVVESLAEHGAKLDEADQDGYTALMLACEAGKAIHVAEFLMHKDVNLQAVNNEGNTALHIACLTKNEDTGKMILEHLVAQKEAEKFCFIINNKKQSILHICVRNGLMDLLVIVLPYTENALYSRDENSRFPLFAGVDDNEVHDCMTFVFQRMIETLSPQDRRKSVDDDSLQSSAADADCY